MPRKMQMCVPRGILSSKVATSNSLAVISGGLSLELVVFHSKNPGSFPEWCIFPWGEF